MPDRNETKTEEFGCPHCGAILSGHATFCRECGASDESGWNEEFDTSGVAEGGYDQDEEDFDYDDFVRREFPDSAPEGIAWNWKQGIAAAIILAVCLALLISIF